MMSSFMIPPATAVVNPAGLHRRRITYLLRILPRRRHKRRGTPHVTCDN